MSKEEVKVELK